MRYLFGTDGIRGTANLHPMTPEIALRLGKALGYMVRKDDKAKIVIGKDTRVSGYMFETALTSGIVSMGVDVYLVGPMPTPAIALLTKSLNASMGIVISASHNPAQDNGIKIFDKDGFKLSDETETEIENLIMTDEMEFAEITAVIADKIGKAFRLDEARGRYIEFAKSTIKDFRLKGLKIVLDCANGAAYYVAPRIFQELGAEVITINNNPDGLNINKECGACYPEFAAKFVKENNADIGIILDGDADRLIVVDENGEVIDGDFILTFCALDMIKENKLNNNTLVITSYSNLGVDEALEKNNGKTIRTDNGDRYVIEAMRKNNFNLGGEASGHMIFYDYTTTGDGIISALQLLKILKQNNLKASDISKVMNKYPQITINIDVKEKVPLDQLPSVQTKIKEVNQKLGNQGRTLIRYSGTQQMCRVMVEGKDEKEVNDYAQQIADVIKNEVGL